MAFANITANITKYTPKVIDQVFAVDSYTDRFFGKNAIKVNFLDAKTVKVFKLATTGLTDYKRGGHGQSNTVGAYAESEETFTLSQERFSEIPVDKLDSEDDAQTVIGHLEKEFIRTKLVPECDVYRFSKLAAATSTTFGNRVVETIAANKIIEKFNAAYKFLKNAKVPSEHQIIFVSTTVMELIRNTTELNKRLTAVETKIGDYYTTIEKYEGREIVEVPEDLFYTNAVLGDGYYPASDSYLINFLIVDETAPIVINKLSFLKLYSSDEVKLDYVGYALQQLYYHDIFIPDNKKIGIYCSVSQVKADTVANSLLVNAVAGAATGKTKITEVLTNPAGIYYDALYLATAATKPAIGSSTASLTQVYIGTEFTPNASHNYIVASADGKAVSVSMDFTSTLPVGA